MEDGLHGILRHNNPRGRPVLHVGRNKRREVRAFALASPHIDLLSAIRYHCLQYLFVDLEYRGQGEAANHLKQVWGKDSLRALVPKKWSAFAVKQGFREVPWRVWRKAVSYSDLDGSNATFATFSVQKATYKTVTLRCPDLPGDGSVEVRAATTEDLKNHRSMAFLCAWFGSIAKAEGYRVTDEDICRGVQSAVWCDDPFFGELMVASFENSLIGAAKLQLQYEAFNRVIAYERHPYVKREREGKGVFSALSRGMLLLKAPPTLSEVRRVTRRDDADPRVRRSEEKLNNSGYTLLDGFPTHSRLPIM
jgi:hypothetical protein